MMPTCARDPPQSCAKRRRMAALRIRFPSPPIGTIKPREPLVDAFARLNFHSGRVPDHKVARSRAATTQSAFSPEALSLPGSHQQASYLCRPSRWCLSRLYGEAERGAVEILPGLKRPGFAALYRCRQALLASSVIRVLFINRSCQRSGVRFAGGVALRGQRAA